MFATHFVQARGALVNTLYIEYGKPISPLSGIKYDMPMSGGHGGSTTTAESCRKLFK